MKTQIRLETRGDKRTETLLRDEVRARGFKVKTGLKAGKKVTRKKATRKTTRRKTA